ncbi:MAG TPA: hypothetical protein VEC35_20915 [Noviherbaspirillum sp.]|nr:hypothetical protein [Noviherbaspirillum sp.]
MDMEEMGQIIAYLVQHRVVETKPARRRTNDEERAVAKLLLALAPDERHRLDRTFVGMRYMLADFDALNVPALPRGARVFLLARDLANGEPSGILSPKVVIDGMRYRGRNEPVRESAAWFVHLWLVHLEMIYTDHGRTPSTMQRFAEGIFEFDDFVGRVREHLEDMRRNVNRHALPESAVFKVFEQATQHEIEGRCRYFVRLMVDASLLETFDKDVYQQTLLSAFEIKQNYERGLQSFVTDANATTHHVAASILTRTDATVAEMED